MIEDGVHGIHLPDSRAFSVAEQTAVQFSACTGEGIATSIESSYPFIHLNRDGDDLGVAACSLDFFDVSTMLT